MLDNPIIRILLLVLGAYFLLALLERLWSPLLLVAVVVAGGMAVLLWILEYERTLAARLYRNNPLLGPCIGGLCKLTAQQVPITGNAQGGQNGHDAADVGSAPVALQSSADFAEATDYLKEVVRGYDATIESALAAIRASVRLRSRTQADLPMPPLATFLFVGRSGLGKRFLAEQVAALVYAGGLVTEIDLRDPYDHLQELVEAVKAAPRQTLIIENIDAADERFLDKLAAILSGNDLQDPDSGSLVSFRDCFVFLLSHQPGEPLNELGPASGTVFSDAVSERLGLPKHLVTLLHGYYAFVLPPPKEQVQVAALLMDRECRKYGLELGSVDPEVLAREAKAITEHGAFDIEPGRVAQRLKRAIAEADAQDAQLVNATSANYRT